MTEEINPNVELTHDEETEQWVARYHALDTPISSCAETREEALANLTNAVASFLD